MKLWRRQQDRIQIWVGGDGYDDDKSASESAGINESNSVQGTKKKRIVTRLKKRQKIASHIKRIRGGHSAECEKEETEEKKEKRLFGAEDGEEEEEKKYGVIDKVAGYRSQSREWIET